jgi:Fuc2NAc and GlcNAc transferase
MNPVIVITTALMASGLLTGIATWYARRRGLMDIPGDRHSHTVATPRGGGAGLILALVFSSLWYFAGESSFWLSCILPGSCVLAVLGGWDDHSPLSARFRFLVQLLVSFYLLWCVAEKDWLHGGIEFVVIGFFLVWMTNLYNFMDGSNGMAGLQAVFAGLVLAGLFLHSENHQMAMASGLLVACSLGFLPWNLGKARVFMGRWYNAHKQHLYQRLIAQGWAHSSVAILYQSINLLLVLPGIVLAVNYPELAWAVVLPLSLILAFGWRLSTKRLGVLAGAG